MYQVKFKKSAYKEYKKLPTHIQKRVDKALTLLRVDPFNELLNIKQLQGHESYYRIRLGDYRLIYTSINEQLIVLIIKIGSRGDVYRLL